MERKTKRDESSNPAIGARQRVFFSEQCYINELSNSADDPTVSIARARVEPVVTTRWHRLRETTERYVIISGKGVVEVGELPPQEVGHGDVVLIPPMCRQRITNSGEEDLIFPAVCSPRFEQANYEELTK
jgi:mannose-6-phosphate isomerase-like protein (cupin superfamily)